VLEGKEVHSLQIWELLDLVRVIQDPALKTYPQEGFELHQLSSCCSPDGTALLICHLSERVSSIRARPSLRAFSSPKLSPVPGAARDGGGWKAWKESCLCLG
jgi:hypothetical protein